MKVRSKSSVAGPKGLSGASEMDHTSEVGATGFSPVDASFGESRGLANFSAVNSRQTHGYYAQTYVAPTPVPNRISANVEKLSIAEITAALADARIPAIGVTLAGTTLTVDGLALQLTPTATGLTVVGERIGLTAAMVETALGKARQLGAMKKALAHIDANKNVMADLKVIPGPNGTFKIKTVAKVTVNPKLDSQGQNILDQLSGDHKMPQRMRAELAARARRTQVVG